MISIFIYNAFIADVASVSKFVLTQINGENLSKGNLSHGFEVQFRPICIIVRYFIKLLETGYNDGCAIFSFSLGECFSKLTLQVIGHSVDSHSLFMITRFLSGIYTEFGHFRNEFLFGSCRGQVEKVK